MRPLLLASSLAFALAAAAADPSVAPQTATSTPGTAAAPSPAATTSPATEAPAKVQSSPAETKPKADAKKSAAEIRKISDDYFKQCMQDWDAATHMTRKEWQRTCRRVVDNRAKFMIEQMGK